MPKPLSPAPAVFLLAFALLFVLVNLLHWHGMAGVIGSASGAGVFVWLSRSWWQRALHHYERPTESWHALSLGNRAARRQAIKRHRHKK